MKRPEEVMEILEAYNLTGSFRQAAVLVGCDHKRVAHWVAVREGDGWRAAGAGAAPTAGGGFGVGEDRGAGRSLARADPC